MDHSDPCEGVTSLSRRSPMPNPLPPISFSTLGPKYDPNNAMARPRVPWAVTKCWWFCRFGLLFGFFCPSILQLPNLAAQIRKFRIEAQYSYRCVEAGLWTPLIRNKSHFIHFRVQRILHHRTETLTRRVFIRLRKYRAALKDSSQFLRIWD